MPIIGATDGSGGGWVTASGKNDGGTLIGAGNVDTGIGPIKNDLAITTIADKFDDITGSKVVSNDGTGAATTDRAGVDKAVSGGTLAFTPTTTGTRSEEFVIMGVSTKIGGVANAQLTSSRAHNDGLIKGGVSKQIIASQSGTFSNDGNTYDVMAAPSTDITPNFAHHNAADYHTVNATATFVNPADGSAAVASEIFPSRAVPGELTYHFGAAGGPTTDEYKAKDAFEDATDTSS